MSVYSPVALTAVMPKNFWETHHRPHVLLSTQQARPSPGHLPIKLIHDDTISYVLHTTPSHLNMGRKNYVKELFTENSSVLNTRVRGQQPVPKCQQEGIGCGLQKDIHNTLNQ